MAPSTVGTRQGCSKLGQMQVKPQRPAPAMSPPIENASVVDVYTRLPRAGEFIECCQPDRMAAIAVVPGMKEK